MLVTNSTYNLGVAAFEKGEIERARKAFDETHALADELGDMIHATAAEFMLAELDLHDGELDDAERRILACLAVYTKLENKRSRAECLVVLAGVAAAKAQFEDAARLVGAAALLRGESPANRFELPVLERYMEEIENHLGRATVAQLEAEGARLDVQALLSPVATSAIRH